MDKTNKNPNVPNLRFKEFHNEYTILSLGQCLKIKSGKSQKNIECNNGKYKIYGTGGIIGFTNEYLYDKESVGIGRKGTINKPFYFNEPFWTVDTLFYSEIKENNVSKYIYYLFQTIPWKKYNTSTGVPSLTSSSIEAIEKGFPLKEEQYKIATFLSFIDKRIQTQIKIINTLISQRKSIFLHHDLKIEKHELLINNLGKVNNGCNLSKEDITRLGKSCILYGELFTTYDHVVNNNVISNTQKTNAKTLYSKKHNLVFPSSTTVDAFSLICPISLNIEGVILGGDLFSIEIYPSFNSDYLSYLINFKYKKELSRYAKGTTIIHLHYEDIKKVKLQVASFEEQDKIAHIMKLITEKIDTEKKLLELFKNQKAYLLNNLFI